MHAIALFLSTLLCLLFGRCDTLRTYSCREEDAMCPHYHQVLDAVDLSVNCSHDGSVNVSWTLRSNYSIKQLQVEYTCENISSNASLKSEVLLVLFERMLDGVTTGIISNVQIPIGESVSCEFTGCVLPNECWAFINDTTTCQYDVSDGSLASGSADTWTATGGVILSTQSISSAATINESKPTSTSLGEDSSFPMQYIFIMMSGLTVFVAVSILIVALSYYVRMRTHKRIRAKEEYKVVHFRLSKEVRLTAEEMVKNMSNSLKQDYSGSQVTLAETLQYPCSAVLHYTTAVSISNDDNISEVTLKAEELI